jgi:hypothetical protein
VRTAPAASDAPIAIAGQCQSGERSAPTIPQSATAAIG